MVLEPATSTTYESVPLYDTGNPQHKSKAKPLRTLKGFPSIPKSGLPPILRLVTFLLLEAGFIVLGIVCLHKPIPLPISNDDSGLREAKAATTAIAIVWHTVAVFMAQDLTVCVFSAECMAQYRLTGKLRHGETDRVSAIHTGLLSRMRHFVSPSATSRYRVAFAAAIILMVLGPIGPAVLTIGSISVQSSEEIRLSMVTIGDIVYPYMKPDHLELLSERAAFVLRMETQENVTFGFETVDEKVLIPWPQQDLKYIQGETITYWTDVVTYNYECFWNASVINEPHSSVDDYFQDTMEVGGIPWKVRLSERLSGLPSQCIGGAKLFRQACLPLVVVPLVNAAILDMYIPAINSSVSGFLFIWSGNYSKSRTDRPCMLPSQGSPGSAPHEASAGEAPTEASVGVASVETSVGVASVETSAGEPPTEGYDISDPLEARILLCNPHLQILPGEVYLKGGKLHLKRLVTDSTRVGNIPGYAANIMVTQALVSATEPNPYASDDALSLFLGQEDFLALEEISHKMNAHMQIAAKVYLSGTFAGNSSWQSWMAQNGTRTHQNPALLSSKPFLLALTAIVASLALMLSSLHVMMQRHHDIQLFDLQHFTIREKPGLTSETGYS